MEVDAGDTFTEVTHENYCQRLGGAICGVFVGIALVIGCDPSPLPFDVRARAHGSRVVLCRRAGPLLWWNEGRAVFTARSIDEGMQSVVEARCDRVDPLLDGELVHVACPLANLGNFSYVEGTIHVPNAVFARRDVEMYQVRRTVPPAPLLGAHVCSARARTPRSQWKEDTTKTTKKDSVGGGSTTRTTYSYHLQWHGSPVDSSRFKRPDGHSNPPAASWPMRSSTDYAAAPYAGAYALPGALLDGFAASTSVPLPPWPDTSPLNQAAPQPPSALTVATTRPHAHYLYTGPADQPKVGTMRVCFSRSTATSASILARQGAGSFGPWTTKGLHEGYNLFVLMEGHLTAHEMFARLSAENAQTTWIMRAVGLVVAWIALLLVTGPASVIPDIVPFLGPLIGNLTGCILAAAMFFLAMGYAAMVVAVAWLRYRPIFAVTLALIAVGGVAVFNRVRSSADRGKFN